jgi:hypothetical protein
VSFWVPEHKFWKKTCGSFFLFFYASVVFYEYSPYCKAHSGPYQTHNTLDCRRYDSNGKPLKAAAGKPSESKKPYKKSGGDEGMAFIQTMFEAYAKSKKKAGGSKKRKKRDYDFSDSSNSEQETGNGDTGFSVDKRLKLDKPLGTIYLSAEPCPLKTAMP